MQLILCLCAQVHSVEQSSGEAEPRAEGGARDEPLSESQSDPAAGPVGRGGAQRKGERWVRSTITGVNVNCEYIMHIVFCSIWVRQTQCKNSVAPVLSRDFSYFHTLIFTCVWSKMFSYAAAPAGWDAQNTAQYSNVIRFILSDTDPLKSTRIHPETQLNFYYLFIYIAPHIHTKMQPKHIEKLKRDRK